MYSTRQFTGSEHLHLGGSELPYDMLRFWQLSLSDILLNMNRGTFAEYIVRCALSDGGFASIQSTTPDSAETLTGSPAGSCRRSVQDGNLYADDGKPQTTE